MDIEDLNLSPHKKRILKLLYSGHSTKDISKMFGISIKTTYAHLSQIYEQYEVSGLLALAIKMGWLRISPMQSDPIENKPNIGLTTPAPL